MRYKQNLRKYKMPIQCLIAVMGAPSVGKSSIISQFTQCQFSESYHPTRQKAVACQNIMLAAAKDSGNADDEHERVYELAIIDVPVVTNYKTSLRDWADTQFGSTGVNNSNAFILVYDVTSMMSFKYIQTLREVILSDCEEGGDPPIVIVGNKRDLYTKRVCSRRQVSILVRKHWKCEYVECSAMYNWNITNVFKELLKRVDDNNNGTSSINGSSRGRSRCVIM